MTLLDIIKENKISLGVVFALILMIVFSIIAYTLGKNSKKTETPEKIIPDSKIFTMVFQSENNPNYIFRKCGLNIALTIKKTEKYNTKPKKALFLSIIDGQIFRDSYSTLQIPLTMSQSDINTLKTGFIVSRYQLKGRISDSNFNESSPGPLHSNTVYYLSARDVTEASTVIQIPSTSGTGTEDITNITRSRPITDNIANLNTALIPYGVDKNYYGPAFPSNIFAFWFQNPIFGNTPNGAPSTPTTCGVLTSEPNVELKNFLIENGFTGNDIFGKVFNINFNSCGTLSRATRFSILANGAIKIERDQTAVSGNTNFFQLASSPCSSKFGIDKINNNFAFLATVQTHGPLHQTLFLTEKDI